MVCCGGLWLLSLLWTVLAVDCGQLLWTVTVDSYSGGLSVEWTVDCELWTVTVVDYLWSGLWWTVDCGWLLFTVCGTVVTVDFLSG